MKLLTSLRAGTHGVTLTLPSHLNIMQDELHEATLFDETAGIVWYLFYFPDLHLVLKDAYWGRQQQALHWHARFMFDDLFHAKQKDAPPGSKDGARPRTDDPGWSPLIEAERLDVGGAAALRVVHRMTYQPGSEAVMGHLLVPLRGGLFEARCLSSDRTTGYRETALFAKLQKKESGPAPSAEELVQAPGRLSQSEMDDARHDGAFPRHPLSRTRAALRWLQQESGLQITGPAPVREEGECELPELGCALLPPYAMVRESRPSATAASAEFQRVSFCGTDGIATFSVHRIPEPPLRNPARLRAKASELTRIIHESAKVADLQFQEEERPDLAGRPQVHITVEGQGHRGKLRNAFRWFTDESGQLWLLGLAGTAAVPSAELAAELDAVARSFRLISGRQAKKSPWWKIW